MLKNLEARTVESGTILITENNAIKDYIKYPEIYSNTPERVREAIKQGKIDGIPPIVVLKSPFDTIEKLIEAYLEYTKAIPRMGEQHYRDEDKVLQEILGQNLLLCYNGNRRLEGFQKAGIPIRAFVITSQEEYDQIPEKERRTHERLKDKKSLRCQIDQNYVLSYLSLLDDAVYIRAGNRYWETLDTKQLLIDMLERRRKRIENE